MFSCDLVRGKLRAFAKSKSQSERLPVGFVVITLKYQRPLTKSKHSSEEQRRRPYPRYGIAYKNLCTIYCTGALNLVLN